MPRSTAAPIAAALLALTVAVTACGGGSAKTPTATPSAQSTAAKTSAATSATKTPTAAATPKAAPTAPAAPSTPAAPPSGAIFTAAQATALLNAASLKAADVGTDWVVQADTTTDNAAAEAADPSTAASNARCGRLSGRTISNLPKDTASAYLGGSIAAAFSQLTVYATAAGAADCSAEAAAKFAQPGALAKAFGMIFVSPEAVKVTPVDYPTVGDGSFATALTGDINAAGTTVQLQIVIVAFLKGNTAGVVGVAYAPLTTPSTKELKPFVDLVLQRTAANQ